MRFTNKKLIFKFNKRISFFPPAENFPKKLLIKSIPDVVAAVVAAAFDDEGVVGSDEFGLCCG